MSDDDGLNIKPPQHLKRREGRHSSQNFDRSRLGPRTDDFKRRNYEDQEKYRRRNPPQETEYNKNRRYEGDGARKRSHNRDEGVEDERARQLIKSKQRRKDAELEEQRMLQEIERRNRREREYSKKTSSKHHRKRGSKSPETIPNQKRREGAKDDKFKEEDEKVIEKEKIKPVEENLPVVEEIVHSSPELKDEIKEETSKEDYHSQVSSEPSENEEEEESNEKSMKKEVSDVSSRSEGSKSSSSRSDSSKDDESDSESSDSEPDKKTKRNGKSLNEKSDDSKSTQKNPLAVPPKKEIDEALITDVDRAIKEVSLLPPYYPAVQGCRRVEEFELLNRIEEGTYGVVFRAKDRRTNEIVALKRLKMEKEKDGFPITSLREINTLMKAQHENIVTVREIVVGSNTDKIFLVMDYVEHDLKALIETLKQKDQKFILGEVKCLLIQLLRAVAHLHDNWILHRDLKTSNLLLSHKGILKVGDFGLAREYGSPLKGYTPIVVTLWYRAPELLLGTKEYSTPIDVWSVGCIFGELVKMEPMFPGKSEANELNLIFQMLGTPNDRIWPGYSKFPMSQKMTFVDQPMNKLKTKFNMSELGIDLMNKFLTYNPAKRITAEDALRHPFFNEAPLPIDPSIFPTWPAKSELGDRKGAPSPPPPSGGAQFKDLKEDDDSTSGFYLGAGERKTQGAGFSLKF